jgi:uncharacterized protein with PIN domain
VSVVYAESSAVLAWLLDEPRHGEVIESLSGAGHVVTSVLTGIECGRSLARGRATGRITAAGELAALRLLDDALASWHVMDVSDDVAARARAVFPREPVRTLEALHLATAMAFHEAVGGVQVLSFDSRVRENAALLGLEVVPRG